MTTPATQTPEDTQYDLETLHHHQTKISGYAGERACRKRPTHRGKRIPFRLGSRGTKQVAFLGGVQKSTAYSCPFAYQQTRANRSADINHLIAVHRQTGGTILFGTFGMRTGEQPAPASFYDPKEAFRSSTELSELVGEFGKFKNITQARGSEAWREFLNNQPTEPSYQNWDLNRRLDATSTGVQYVFAARDFGRLQKRVGVQGVGWLSITEVEVRPSTHGWGRTTNNVHIHFLLFLRDTTVPEKTRKVLLRTLHSRWRSEVEKHGFTTTLAGADIRTLDDTTTPRFGQYLAKGTRPGNCGARLGGSYWNALRASAAGDWRATVWWQNWEGAVRGRHLFRVSQGLAKQYDLAGARDQRFKKWREAQSEPVTIAFLDAHTWYLTASVVPEFRDALREVAEQEGVEGARRFLEDNGFAYTLTDDE